jgi:putative effector of murein hydrolase LrgA (UPF0299 family)
MVRLVLVPQLGFYAASAWAHGDASAIAFVGIALVFHILLVAIIVTAKEVPRLSKALCAGAYLIFVPSWTVVAAYIDTYTTFHQTWFFVVVPVGVAIGARKLLTRKHRETHRESGADPASR